jgi:O-antigen/teichoic acid export membrane protein
MRARFFTETAGTATPAAVLMAARIANMVLALAVIPVLLSFLGTESFAAWALLLALAAMFSLLELSMPPSYVRSVAPLMHGGQRREASQVTSNALCIVFATFAIAAIPAVAATAALVDFFKLPDGEILSAQQLVWIVYFAAACRALLQFGTLKLNASRRFGALAASSFLQSFSSNLAAALAAIITGKLEYTVLAFWGAQLLSLAAVAIAARVALPDFAFERAAPTLRGIRALLKHALPLQIYDWAQIVSYQFDKFLIAALVGLPSVALYEIGNRSVLALRSIPSSAIDSFLATAAIGQSDRDALWHEYERMTQFALIAVFVFILAPLAVAPMMLYAWTGNVGYEARWIFAFLAIGSAFSVLALPAAAMGQAAGRPDLQARAAIVGLFVNVPLSYFLVTQFGAVGAAAGTSVAMSLGATLNILTMHSEYRQGLRNASTRIKRILLIAAILTGLAVLIWTGGEYWLSKLLIGSASAAARATAAVAAITLYLVVVCFICVAHFTETVLGQSWTALREARSEHSVNRRTSSLAPEQIDCTGQSDARKKHDA